MPSEASCSCLTLDLHPGYGDDPELATSILRAALTAELPVLLDHEARLLALPPASVRQFTVRVYGEPEAK